MLLFAYKPSFTVFYHIHVYFCFGPMPPHGLYQFHINIPDMCYITYPKPHNHFNPRLCFMFENIAYISDWRFERPPGMNFCNQTLIFLFFPSPHHCCLKVDMFSYGMVLYELLSGRRPSLGQHQLQIAKKLSKGIRPVLGSPEEVQFHCLHSMLTECWDTKPEKVSVPASFIFCVDTNRSDFVCCG